MAQPGERVWIRHATEVWEPAVVDAVDGLSVQVHAVGGARELTFKDTATLEDGVKRRNEGDIATVDDLVRLPFLHEPAILHVLRSRARAGLIYTNVGAILLAVNPFKRLTSLYDKDAVETQRNAGALRAADPGSAPPPPPHCFAVADQAYRQMRSALTGRKPADQAILISGESGPQQRPRIAPDFEKKTTGRLLSWRRHAATPRERIKRPRHAKPPQVLARRKLQSLSCATWPACRCRAGRCRV